MSLSISLKPINTCILASPCNIVRMYINHSSNIHVQQYIGAIGVRCLNLRGIQAYVHSSNYPIKTGQTHDRADSCPILYAGMMQGYALTTFHGHTGSSELSLVAYADELSDHDFSFKIHIESPSFEQK